MVFLYKIVNKQRALLTGGILLAMIFVGVFSFFNFSKKQVENKEKINENVKIKADLQDEYCKNCNVILVTMDTTRADHFSSYGYFRDTTTEIDKLAQKGVLFENNFVQMPFTPTSHWSIMTGLYPYTHKHFTQGTAVKRGETQDTKFPIMAKILKTNGYKTAAFVSSNMVQSLTPGFDKFDFTMSSRQQYFAKEVTDKAISWVKDNQNNNFFVWLHYWDPHAPHKAFKNYAYENKEDKNTDRKIRRAEYERCQYDGEIKYVDHEFGGLIKALEELNLSKKTLIIITADHGEGLGEHKIGKFIPSKAEDLIRGHFQTLYDEELHTPLIIFNPKENYQGKRIKSITQEIDILPTILDMLHIEISEILDGKSLYPLIKGEVDSINNYAFSVLRFLTPPERRRSDGQADSNRRKRKKDRPSGLRISLRVDKWKLVRFVDTINKKKNIISYVLYNLKQGENENVLKNNKKVGDEMIKQIEAVIKAGKINNENIDLSEEEIKTLKSLGYLR